MKEIKKSQNNSIWPLNKNCIFMHKHIPHSPLSPPSSLPLSLLPLLPSSIFPSSPSEISDFNVKKMFCSNLTKILKLIPLFLSNRYLTIIPWPLFFKRTVCHPFSKAVLQIKLISSWFKLTTLLVKKHSINTRRAGSLRQATKQLRVLPLPTFPEDMINGEL